YNVMADKVSLSQDPIQPFKNRPLEAQKESRNRTLLNIAKGAVTGLAASGGWMAGAAAGMALNTISLPQQAPVKEAGNVAGLETMEVPQLWEKGLTGKGVGIAVLDTGCAKHPDLEGKVTEFHDFFYDEKEQYDNGFHGTGVCTLLAGSGQGLNGQVKGVAPDAELAVLKVTDTDGGLESVEVLEALKWVEENRERLNLQVVNMSFGLDEGWKKVDESLARLANHGVLISTSAGNTGPKPSRFDSFKTSPNLLTVTSSDTAGTPSGVDDVLSSTASRPRPEDKVGPDVSTPGIDLIVGAPGGKYTRVTDGGTSFASALNSGVMALWKQALPQITIEDVEAALKATSVPLNGANALEQGHGSLRAAQGLEFLRERIASREA
ncbi:MAG: S8 family serine peptidase, partial [Candidatus Eremiobacteraeota bacterium]|nr:S8 family serine peptidase [Candidatus Eremiobacteraeota bacterium]